MLKKLLFTSLGALLCSAVFATSTISTTSTAKPKPKVEMLFTQMAQSASLTPIKNKSGWYKLTLTGVNGSTTWFTDRPQRKTGVVATSQFVQDWTKGKASFSSDAPNASMVYLTGHKPVHVQKQVVMKLTNPIYSAKSKTLSYDVNLVGNSVTLAKNGREVVLFIDSAPCFFICF